MDFKTAIQNHKNAAALRRETKNTIKRLDENIYLMDYRNDYFIDELLETGVSSIGDLVAFAVKKFNVDFTVGSQQGSGCTSFEAHNPDGDHMLCRNFDFKAAPCFVVWTHPKGHYESIGVVDNNFMLYGQKHLKYKKGSSKALLAPYCCVDGMNECGLSIAVLQIRAAATKQTDKSKKNITTTAMIRGVLDTCKDVDEAVEFISSYNMIDSLFTNYHYQICDSTGRSVVVEYINNELKVYERNSGKYPEKGSVYEDDGLDYQYVCNYTITKEIGDFKAEQHGEDRTDAVKKVMNEKKCILTETEAMDLLSYVRLDYDHPKYPWFIIALWSAVYNNNRGTLTLAAGTDYSRVYTFDVKKPLEILKKESIDTVYPKGNWQYL